MKASWLCSRFQLTPCLTKGEQYIEIKESRNNLGSFCYRAQIVIGGEIGGSFDGSFH